MKNFETSAFSVFCHLAGRDLPDRETLEQCCSQRHMATGEPLFHAGERCPYVFVVSKGIIKMIYETAKGDAWVKGFAQTGMCFASLTALTKNGVASYSTFAAVESVAVQIDYRTLEGLADRHMGWQRAMSNAFKFYGQRKEQREMELLTLSPEERYRSFVQDQPELAASLKQHDIAAFIRVTPVALSRIKSRLKAREIETPLLPAPRSSARRG
jgi:CRP-like cAMP-binding protein